MLQDLKAFLYALWGEWKALLTGGSIIASLALFQLITHRSVPHFMDWLIIGLSLIGAAFLSWRKEWINSGRGLINIDLEEIRQLFSDHTTPHAKLRVRQLIGKRTILTGTLYDLSNYATFASVHMNTDKAMFHLQVSRWKLRTFQPLTKGTLITVNGRIHIRDGMVTLSSCEVLKIEDKTRM